MPQINILAILAATVSSFVLGGLWYSPILFAKAWMRECGLTEDKVNSRNKGMIFGPAIVLNLVGVFVFAMFLGPNVTPVQGTLYGFSAGLAWVGGSIGIGYLFEGRSFKLFLINAGYETIKYTLIGLILGLWH